MSYPKIETLFNRSKEDFKVLEDSIRREEFLIPKYWQVTEKIDGTNIRIIFMRDCPVIIKGRTDRAQIPVFLKEYLQRVFTYSCLNNVFKDLDLNKKVIIYGEGYGTTINKKGKRIWIGRKYRSEGAGFRLFDIWIGPADATSFKSGWWLKTKDRLDISSRLGVPHVPILSRKMTINEIVRFVKKEGLSPTSLLENGGCFMEGIVARTEPLLLMRNGERLMFKLKHSDFRREENDSE